MKKIMMSIGMLALLVVAACGGGSGKVLVEVNGNDITEGDLKFLSEINPRIQAQIASPAGQKKVLDNLVEQDLLYQAAVKEGVNRDDKVKAKIDLYKQVIIAQALIEAETENAAKKYYDEHADEFKKLKISQIMVKFATPEEIKKAKKGEKMKTEEEALKAANEIKAKLDNGGNFAKLAEEFSDDASTKSRGGDLGPVSKGDKRIESRGFAQIVDKAFEMKVGEVAGPIKTAKGYHIITVTQGAELAPFDVAKQEILFKIQNDTRQNLLAKLKKDAKIVYPQEEKEKKAADKKKGEVAKPAKGQTEGAKPSGEVNPAPAASAPAPTDKPANPAGEKSAPAKN